MKTTNKPRFIPVILAVLMLMGAAFTIHPSASETETTLYFEGSESALETEFLAFNPAGDFKNVLFGKTGYLKNGRLCSSVCLPADTDYDIIAVSSGGETPEYKEYHFRAKDKLDKGLNTDCYGIGEHFPAVFEVVTGTDFEKLGYKYDWKIKNGDGGYSDISVPHYENGLTLIIPDIRTDYDKKQIAFRVFDGNEFKDELVFNVSVSAGDIKYVKNIVLCGDEENVISAMPSFFNVTDAKQSSKDGKTVLDVTLKSVGGYKFQFNNGYIPVKYFSFDGVCKSPSTKALITDTVTLSVEISEKQKTEELRIKTVKLEDSELEKGVVLDDGALAVCVPPYAEYFGNIVKSDFPASFYAVKGNEITYYTPKNAPGVSAVTRDGEVKTYLGEATKISAKGYPLGNVFEAVGFEYTCNGFDGVPKECGAFDFTYYTLNYGTKTVERHVLPVTVYENRESYTVSFVKNGGAGDMEKITVSGIVKSFTVPECSFIPPKNKVFSHFEYNGERYLPGQVRGVYSNVTLTAVWDDAEPAQSTADKPAGKPTDKPEPDETDLPGETYSADTTVFDNPATDAASGDEKSGGKSERDGTSASEKIVTGEKSEEKNKLVILVLVIICVCLFAGVIALTVTKKRK